MLNVEVMEQMKGIELYSGPGKGFVMTNLLTRISHEDGSYARLIDFIEHFHWENAGLYRQTEKVCFFRLGLNSELGVAVSGKRTVGPEHLKQIQRISAAMREAISQGYESFSDDEKKTADFLLKDYEENGIYLSFERGSTQTVYYDNGEMKEVPRKVSPLSDRLSAAFDQIFASASSRTEGKITQHTPDGR